MGTHRVSLFLFSVAAFHAAAFGQKEERPPSLTEWRDDIDAVVRDLRAIHPAPFQIIGEMTFLRDADALKRALPEMSEEQRVAGVMRLVARLGDGHTVVQSRNDRFAWWYPIRVEEFTDGYFVTSAHESMRELVGAQLLQVAGKQVVEVMERARDLIGCENSSCRKERVYAFHNAALMKGLGYADADRNLKVKFKLADGKVVDRILPGRSADDPNMRGDESTFEWQYRSEMMGPPSGRPAQWISAYKSLPAPAFFSKDTSRPLHLMQRSRYTSLSIPEKQAFYIQLNQTDDTNFVTFIHDAMRAVDTAKPKRLIIDLRYNFGGDSSRASEVVHEFIRREETRTWELYVLTAGKTFSAGIGFLHALMEHVPLTIIGEPAGAPLNFYGDTTTRAYRATGLELHVSTLRHQFSDSADLSEVVAVDIPAPFSFADYVAGRDPAIDPILGGEEMRGLDALIRAEGGAAARRAWQQRKSRFSMYPWWTPPREPVLRAACRDLEKQQRMPEALEACKLTTEIQPNIWNSWYNLGNVQRAMGMLREAVENYRRVLEIDPVNFNGQRLRAFINQYGGVSSGSKR